jgi:hypothetical protein
VKHYFKLFAIITIIFSIFSASGCAKRSVYTNWAQQLNNNSTSIDDVSLLLGTPPIKCENVDPTPVIGLVADKENTILSVNPKCAAATAGIRKGEKILRVNNISVSDREETGSTIKSNLKWDEPINIGTQIKTYTLIPKRPNEAIQCYWDLSAGSVAKSSSGAYVDRYAGASSSSGAQYERFFRTSCRFYDGYSVSCQSNWQE